MKKITILIPSLGGGGAEKVLVNLLNYINHEKYDITLISIFGNGTNEKFLNPNVKYKYLFKKQFIGNSHILKLFTPNVLFKLFIKEKCDVVISYLEGPSTRIVSGCNRTDTKLVNWVHTEVDHVNTFIAPYRSKKEFLKCYERFDATIFISETARIAFEKKIKLSTTNHHVKYNTVDTFDILKKAKEPIDDCNLNNEIINVVSVGRFTEVKGYERLLRIVKKLKEENFQFHLYLIGDGELGKLYTKFIKENFLEDYVTLLGYKMNPIKYVANCDLFVCSSYSEGYSTSVTESLIVGTPVITTLCSGMTELLGEDGEFGVITDNDEDSLYRGLKEIFLSSQLLDEYKKRIKVRARSFSTEKTVRAVEALLDEITL
nr:glycosyltransferase [uncultured Trichococcus sp.]